MVLESFLENDAKIHKGVQLLSNLMPPAKPFFYVFALMR